MYFVRVNGLHREVIDEKGMTRKQSAPRKFNKKSILNGTPVTSTTLLVKSNPKCLWWYMNCQEKPDWYQQYITSAIPNIPLIYNSSHSKIRISSITTRIKSSSRILNAIADEVSTLQ